MASAAIPGIFLPVNMGGDTYVDGGVRDVLPIQMAVNLGADKIYAVSADPLEAKESIEDYQQATLIDIVNRAVLNLLTNEIAQNDIKIQPSTPDAQLPQMFDIRPDQTDLRKEEIHDSTTIDPGLIRINMDYGYMRAADVIGGVDKSSRRWELSKVIAYLRKDIWTLENRCAGQPDPTQRAVPTPTADPDLQAEIDQKKRELQVLINERRSANGPMPGDINRWVTKLELHPWWSDPGAPPAGGDPANYFGTVPRVLYSGQDNHIYDISIYQ